MLHEPVRFEHVRGHRGEVGNEGADRLAVQGTQQFEIPERNWAAARTRTVNESATILWNQAGKKRPKQVESISGGSGQPAEISAEEEELWKGIDLTELLDFVVRRMGPVAERVTLTLICRYWKTTF